MIRRSVFVPVLRVFAVAVVVTAGVISIIASGGGGGGGGGGGSNPPPASLTSVTVTPAAPVIVLGADQQFAATGNYSDGSTRSVTATATWSSSDPGTATIDASGLATSVAQGVTTITATYGGESGTATLTVDPAVLASIAVTPTDPMLGYRGATQQFTATGTYTNQATADLTGAVAWSSSDAGVAVVGADGFARVVGTDGSAVISAETGGISGSTTLTVQTATVTGEVNFPASDMGWQPSHYTLLAHGGASVRVQGTDVAVDVTATSATTGAYTLTGVPWGDVTLIFDEGPDYDAFTQASKRLSINVDNAVIDNADFSFVYHWDELLGYPPVWGTAPWKAQFVSPEIAFVAFRRDVPSERIELYRTTDRGANWSLIGEWIFDQAAWDTATWAYPMHWQNFHFLDADRGVMHATTAGIPCDVGANYFYTADGGQTWNLAALPLTPTGYHVTTSAYARIGDDHLVMAGRVGCGVQGYNAGAYDAIWESTNAGADWTLAWHSARDEYGTFIGVDANDNGRAVAYRGANIQQFLLRDDQGNWAPGLAGVIYSTGRDIAMVDDTAWVTSYGGAPPSGLYQSLDAGASWQRLSGALVQDFDFVSPLKGFGQAGGPAHVTYDAGLTWRYQSGGGAVWPGVMDVWGFDLHQAAWAETGFGDPNQTDQLFTYVEPLEANLELRENVTLADANAARGASDVPMLSIDIESYGPATLSLPTLAFSASGSGDDATDIAAVTLWWDRNADGIADAGDTELASGPVNADDGSVALSTGQAALLDQLDPVSLLVTVDLSGAAGYSGTYRLLLDVGNVAAQDADTGDPVAPSMPPELVIASRTLTVLP
jgi:hypothetical protein